MKVAVTFKSGLSNTHENAHVTVDTEAAEIWVVEADSGEILDTHLLKDVQSVLIDFSDEKEDPTDEGN